MKKITYNQGFIKKTYKTKKIDNIDNEKSKEKLIRNIINDYSSNKNKSFSKSDSAIHLDFKIDSKNVSIEIFQEGNKWTYTTTSFIPIDIIKNIKQKINCLDEDFFINYGIGFEYFVFIKTNKVMEQFILNLLELE